MPYGDQWIDYTFSNMETNRMFKNQLTMEKKLTKHNEKQRKNVQIEFRFL